METIETNRSSMPHMTWKDKLTALPAQVKSTCVTKLGSVKTRTAEIKPMVAARARNLSSGVQQQLRAKPAMWAGVAAGAGLGLGIMGRIMRNRMHRDVIPTLIIVEAC
jgi:ElaB/YqjD/DUF883 family membrane-anchored ribosome-binding protein